MSNKNKQDGVFARFFLLERKDGAVSTHYSPGYCLLDNCDSTIFADDARRIAEDPENASKLDCFVPGKSE